MAAVRMFVAITLHGSLHTTLGEIIGKLSSSGAKVKWVEPENVHLTLKFLGNVEEERLPEIFAACGRAAEGFGPIDLEMRALGCFPNNKSPRIVWLGIQRGVEAVTRLQEKVERELQAIGFSKEEKPFRAHLTIGRVKGKQGISRLCRLLEEERNIFLGSMRAEKISVMKSKTLPAGPVYTELRAIPLL
ncbi:MAG: RNA 2',3'-cyclic phosphodiesterase [Candidatus Abyssobacteria bacterium SURF_5]|uniref:RNA 2',3'-cyclic phosphodiesterase n=1 Tax=Abyssobacteria bacterium (strain SURF_5) TaxID=2093360 RepID=A0A3A4N7I5_ABYX5|nr:MAG: RNA 2',3'-cyclic phosphodiesterase [Candidatus Abyssubacteria bacterium SURF_5]